MFERLFPDREKNLTHLIRIVLVIGLAVLLVWLFGVLSEAGILADIPNVENLKQRIETYAPWGPFVVMGLIAAAIIFSPLPSAPIALAAGALYGHTVGSVYVIIGAEVGALAAFLIARMLGYGMLKRVLGARLDIGLLGSQNSLMAIVFLSRLVPFISFDLVSYAAGLTPLAFWRFALVTFAGITPISFLLAHFGNEMASLDDNRIFISVLALGGITLIPVAARFLWGFYRRRIRERDHV